MKTSEALSMIGAINTMANRKTPNKFSYACARNATKLESEQKAFSTAYDKLVDEHAEKDADGKQVPGDKEGTTKLKDSAAFLAALEELQNTNIAVDLHKVELDHFPADIEPALMMALMPMVKE